MEVDILTVGVGVVSFVVFLLLHGITFRWVRPERLLRSLLTCTIIMLAFPVVLMIGLFMLKAMNATLQVWVCAAILASVIEGLLCFVYVLCIFGPYETSVRMRLVREIAAAPAAGITMKELLGRYSPETMVNIRLARLIGSGDIVEKDGKYYSVNTRNFFFIFDAIAGVIKKWIG